MEEILLPLIGSLSHIPLFTGFYTSKRWLFGISEPSTVSGCSIQIHHTFCLSASLIHTHRSRLWSWSTSRTKPRACLEDAKKTKGRTRLNCEKWQVGLIMLIILMMDAHLIAIHERRNVTIEYNIRISNITIQNHKLKLLCSTASIGKWYPSATDHSDPPWLLDNLRQVQPREMSCQLGVCPSEGEHLGHPGTNKKVLKECTNHIHPLLVNPSKISCFWYCRKKNLPWKSKEFVFCFKVSSHLVGFQATWWRVPAQEKHFQQTLQTFEVRQNGVSTKLLDRCIQLL